MLLDDAQRLLDGGQRDAGQRLLELLIARYPATSAAGEARKRIIPLYARDEAPSAAKASATRVQPGTEPPASIVTEVPSGPWRVDVERNTAAENDFRSKAGDRVFFSPGSAELGSRARAVLQAQAKWLIRYAGLYVVVEGHADDPGSDEANSVIARARAEAVRGRLIEEGVAPDRIRVLARGNAQRVAECLDAVCSAQNRRAVTVVVDAHAALQPGPSSEPGPARPSESWPGTRR